VALGPECFEVLGGAGLVGDPLLAAFIVPGPGETLRRIRQVAGSDIDVTGLAGSAHGDICELSAASVVEDVSDVHRGALGAVTRDGIPVTEAFGADVVGPKIKDAAVGRDCGDRLGASTRELMARMGHASASAALRYQHATRDRDRAIAEALSSLASAAHESHAAGKTEPIGAHVHAPIR
jgi:hypothetical protein